MIGGGNTAIDAAIAARHLGADARDHSVPAHRKPKCRPFEFEYEHAKREGVRFVWNTRAVAFRGEESV